MPEKTINIQNLIGQVVIISNEADIESLKVKLQAAILEVVKD